MHQTALQEQPYWRTFSIMLLPGMMLLLSACATTPQPTPDDDMYALSALEAMSMLRDIKENRTHPNHSPVTCSLSATDRIEIYTSNGFVIEEYWLTRRNNNLYLGIQHEYGRKLFEFGNGRLYKIVEPTFFAHDIDADIWARFWLGQVSIHDVGENKITSKVAYDGGDELLEKIGTTRIKIFLDPVYSFLDTYYGVNDEFALQPVSSPLSKESDCANPAVQGTIVGK